MVNLIIKFFFRFSMAIVAAVDGGWIIDHEQSINAAYAETRVCCHNRLDAEDGSRSCSICSVRMFMTHQDMFAINEPFRMDSHFAKLADSSALKSAERNLQVFMHLGNAAKHCINSFCCYFNKYSLNYCWCFLPWSLNGLRVKSSTTFGITETAAHE